MKQKLLHVLIYVTTSKFGFPESSIDYMEFVLQLLKMCNTSITEKYMWILQSVHNCPTKHFGVLFET